MRVKQTYAGLTGLTVDVSFICFRFFCFVFVLYAKFDSLICLNQQCHERIKFSVLFLCNVCNACMFMMFIYLVCNHKVLKLPIKNSLSLFLSVTALNRNRQVSPNQGILRPISLVQRVQLVALLYYIRFALPIAVQIPWVKDHSHIYIIVCIISHLAVAGTQCGPQQNIRSLFRLSVTSFTNYYTKMSTHATVA